MIVITHELLSIENISHRCIMLDGATKGIIAIGAPGDLKSGSENPRVQAFFKREPLK
jgi:phospholipid/cholesterol/gamma-HCH transport system ATP-binding protein